MEMNTFYVLFAAAIIASAKSQEMKASYNNLPNQTKGVIVNPRNPENPDSNNWLLRAPTKLTPYA
jgi:ribosomal silencing factor RsfS